MFNQVRPINKSFCLQMLCEENYAKLQRLTPHVHDVSTQLQFVNINILEEGPYTQVIELRQQETNLDSLSAGYFKCRIYFDTKSVEVISIGGYEPTPIKVARTPREILNKKWALNYLLEKWLNFQFQSLNQAIKRPQSLSA